MGIYASATTAEELFARNNPDTTIVLERPFALDRPLTLLGDIVTRSLGSRGFNNHDGTVERPLIGRIETFGDGAVGFRIGKPVGTVSIARGIAAHGGTGMSLVKGAMKELQAHVFSIIEGGSAAQASIGGPIRVDDPGRRPSWAPSTSKAA